MSRGGRPPFVVLDDDPTGVQTLAGIRVLLSWDAGRIAAALDGRSALHLITNTRALPAEHVEDAVEQAARQARIAAPEARLVLRGDSTLRGYPLEEYLGVRSVVAPGGWPVLLLVPALPSAGRITAGGVHFFVRDGLRVPLHETEYARDATFAYASARVLEWAEERSRGVFPARSGAEVPLAELRTRGSQAVSELLAALAHTRAPAALVPDVESEDDLALIAQGYEEAVADGVDVIVRCAPAFAGVLAGTTAKAAAPLPDDRAGLLVVCGSYVEQTTRQLARLLDEIGHAPVEVDVVALAGSNPGVEIERAAAAASRQLVASGIAVVSTPRSRPEGTTTLEAGEQIAFNLARVAQLVLPRPGVVVVKGGITSAVLLRDGVGASEADVLGPVMPGVSRWSASWPDGTPLDYLVVPGNVGDDDLLRRLVSDMRGSTVC